MMHTAVVLIGAVAILAAVAAFFASFWRREAPKADNSSRSDWAALTGGGYPPDHHSGSDHGGAP